MSISAPEAGAGEASAGSAHGFPVVELFGPTIQGEGPEAGMRSFFVRLGGCDYRCSWCDSLHAVEPELVRQAPRRTSTEIVAGLVALGAGHEDLVILSGGNPALHKADSLVAELHDETWLVSVETQGSFWRDWLASVDRLVVSPKPPSSGEATGENAKKFRRFMDEVERSGALPMTALKIVVFARRDYNWARRLIRGLVHRPDWVGLSCGTDALGREPLARTARRYQWLAETVAADPAMREVVVLPQLHVIAWGHTVGR